MSNKKTGFFHVEEIGKRWWLVTPAGNAHFMLAVQGGKPYFGFHGLSREEWGRQQAGRLRYWGFNATGSNRKSVTSDFGMPYTMEMSFSRLASLRMPLKPTPGYPPWMTFADVFDPKWAADCERHAEKLLKPLADDRLLVGYYLDNEMCLTGWYGAITKSDPDAPARKAFVEVAREYYADKQDQLGKDWAKYGVTKVDDLMQVRGEAAAVPALESAWNKAVAERFFSTAKGACAKFAPKHICLGVRLFVGDVPPPEVLSVMAKYCDVISVNLYSPIHDRMMSQMFTMLPAFHKLTGRPLLTSEFSYRGADTLCPSTLGAPPTVLTQADRAVGYMSYISVVASMPFYVGACWFRLPDDQQDVEWVGWREDCNFGMLDVHNRPYAVLTEAMRQVNTSIYELAADPVRSKECRLFWRTELARWDLDWNERMLRHIANMSPPPDPMAMLFPARRRYHEVYWVKFRSPSLVVNDDRIMGCMRGNMFRKRNGCSELVLLGTHGYMSAPRGFWYGTGCSDPKGPCTLESNAQVLFRRVDKDGRLLRMTLVDGSFVKTEIVVTDVRANLKIPYLDLRFEPDGKRVLVTTRGEVKRLGIRDVSDWQVEWNGREARRADPKQHPAPDGVTVFLPPE